MFPQKIQSFFITSSVTKGYLWVTIFLVSRSTIHSSGTRYHIQFFEFCKSVDKRYPRTSLPDFPELRETASSHTILKFLKTERSTDRNNSILRVVNVRIFPYREEDAFLFSAKNSYVRCESCTAEPLLSVCPVSPIVFAYWCELKVHHNFTRSRMIDL